MRSEIICHIFITFFTSCFLETQIRLGNSNNNTLAFSQLVKKENYVFYRSIPKWLNKRTVSWSRIDNFLSPFVVAILDKKWNQACTATAITNRWCVTAAHCFMESFPKAHSIRINSVYSKRGGQLHIIYNTYQHPMFDVAINIKDGRYVVEKLKNDFGMLSIVEEMGIASHLRYPIIAPYDSSVRITADMYGFGMWAEEKGAELAMSQVRLVPCDEGDWDACACVYMPEDFGVSVCEGDSGGPVLFNGTIIGVTSLGPIGCTSLSRNAHLPNVITLLFPYLDLVKGTINRSGTLMMSPVNSQCMLSLSLFILFCNVLIIFL